MKAPPTPTLNFGTLPVGLQLSVPLMSMALISAVCSVWAADVLFELCAAACHLPLAAPRPDAPHASRRISGALRKWNVTLLGRATLPQQSRTPACRERAAALGGVRL